MFKTILAPLDGSDLAASALPLVEAIAMKTGSGVAVMTVLTPVVEWDATVRHTTWKPLEGAAVEYLNAKRDELTAAGLKAHTAVRWGEPWKAICEAAESERAGLIAMTTHGRSGLSRWTLGSVADRVLHESSVPVLLLHPQESETLTNEIKRILVPVDGSDLSLDVLPFAGQLAAALSSKVTLIHILTPLSLAYVGTGEYVDPSLWDQFEVGAKETLARAAAELEHLGVRVEQITGNGTAPDGIVEQARNADLIVMSTHGRSGIGRWVVGSVADAVVRRSHVPCLLYRPEQIRELRPPSDVAPVPRPRDVPEHASLAKRGDA